MDRIDAMRTFIAVAAEGSFVKAAERLQQSPQLVSKYVGQLEQHLGIRLFNRTTRRVHLTEAGQQYQLRARQLLEELDDLESQLGDLQGNAQGLLRISAPVSFAALHLAKLLHGFQQLHPRVGIDVQLNDRKVDIVEEGFDIALRIGRLKDSSLIAKHLAPVRLLLCAAPHYLQQYGQPTGLGDLAQHRYLHYSYLENTLGAELHAALQAIRVRQQGELISNNGDILVQAAIAGGGIILQPSFIVGAAINAGQLQVILPQYEPPPLGLYAVYAHRQLLASKVRYFLEFSEGFYGSPPYWDDFANA